MSNISLSDVTNGSIVNGKWVGTGVFDKLAEAVSANIQIQYDQGQIKGSDYANAYVASLQSVLQQSIEYVLKEKLISAQIDEVLKDIEFKDAQKKLVYVERVIKDKEAAALGLDSVVKIKEASRASGTYVYTPSYEEVV